MDLKQYQIILVNLDPTIGSEIKKIRPCVIISPDEINSYLQTIVIAPITGSSKPYPTRIEFNHTITKGWIVLDHIRSIDKRRIIKVFELLAADKIRELKSIIRETYVD